MADPTSDREQLHPCVRALYEERPEALTRHELELGGGRYSVLCQDPGWRARPFGRCAADRKTCPVHSVQACLLPRGYPRAVWLARPEAFPAALEVKRSKDVPARIVGAAPGTGLQRWLQQRGCRPVFGLVPTRGGARAMLLTPGQSPLDAHRSDSLALAKLFLAITASMTDKWIATFLTGAVLLASGKEWPSDVKEWLLIFAEATVLYLTLAFVYLWLCEAFFSRTLGQRLLGLRVTDERGQVPGLRRAFVREFTGLVPRYLPRIGDVVRMADYSWLLVSEGRQQLRDVAAGTQLLLRITPVGRTLLRLATPSLSRLQEVMHGLQNRRPRRRTRRAVTRGE